MKTAIQAKRDKEMQVGKDKSYAKAMQTGTAAEAQAAFNQLYKRYKSAIFFMVLKAFKMNEETAQDLTQEIFAKVYEKIAQYNFSTAFSTWMYNIATNHIIDYKRKEKYEVLSIETLKTSFGGDEDVAEISFQLEDKNSDSHKALVRQENAACVRMALNKVKSDVGREIVTLIFFQGLPYEETAQHLNMPIGTVKALLVRAKNEMKETIKNYLKKETYDISIDYGKSCRLK